MQSSLRIFSAHITMNVIEIEVSAPLGSRAMISCNEHLRFPELKIPSISFRLGWTVLSCCLYAVLPTGSFDGLPNHLPEWRILFLAQKLRFLVLI
jgi:hypothetical protein